MFSIEDCIIQLATPVSTPGSRSSALSTTNCEEKRGEGGRVHFTNPYVNKTSVYKGTWPPQSPDMNPCYFWLWDYLNDVEYGGQIANFAELKNRITEHIRNITTETLPSSVEHAVLSFQLIGENGGQYLEHFLSKSKPTSFS
ncbi:hypothetical protein AVEN_235941-1 [Araneus ventricosus]|uniref:Uncharacterized protein n=1 Tax=Araneus ventricosus TaxID=182803 RepID=A0A4Y2MUP6_ARAVE|nr:hypothetical protein AVEN_235941-1 [Araneus ventricosus]